MSQNTPGGVPSPENRNIKPASEAKPPTNDPTDVPEPDNTPPPSDPTPNSPPPSEGQQGG